MTHIRHLTIGIVLSISFSCSGPTDQKDIIFNSESQRTNLWISTDTTYQLFTPTIDEIDIAKGLSINYIDSVEQINKDKNHNSGKILGFNHSDYYRQYIGYIDNKGHKVIFINAICSASGDKNDLKKTWWFVLDGGSCYYQIQIDLKTKKCFDFAVNGEA